MNKNKNMQTKYYETSLQKSHWVYFVLVIFCRAWGLPLSVVGKLSHEHCIYISSTLPSSCNSSLVLSSPPKVMIFFFNYCYMYIHTHRYVHVFRADYLEYDVLYMSSSFEETNSTSLSSSWSPTGIHLRMGHCRISLVHVSMSIDIIIILCLFR